MGERFDDITRLLASEMPRRDLVRSLLALALGATSLPVAVRAATRASRRLDGRVGCSVTLCNPAPDTGVCRCNFADEAGDGCCCPGGTVYCGDANPDTGSRGTCCPRGRDCCTVAGAKDCCPADRPQCTSCGMGGDICCERGSICVDGVCCPPARHCAGIAVCCAPGTVCRECGGFAPNPNRPTKCCPPDQFCARCAPAAGGPETFICCPPCSHCVDGACKHICPQAGAPEATQCCLTPTGTFGGCCPPGCCSFNEFGAVVCCPPPGFRVMSMVAGPPATVTMRALTYSAVGLSSVKVVKAVNATVSIPYFHVGASYVDAVATKIDPSKSAQVVLRACTDCQGCNCPDGLCCHDGDPVIVTLLRHTGQPVTETYTDLPQAESRVAIHNGAPGLRNLRITVNGRQFQVAGMKDGEQVAFDVASAMRPGNANTISITPLGAPGGSATIFITD